MPLMFDDPDGNYEPYPFGPFTPGPDRLGLTPTAVKTSAYNALPGDWVLCDVSAAGFTVTLPTAPIDGTVIAIKIVVFFSTSGGALTVAAGGSDVFNVASGPTSTFVFRLNETRIFQYKASAAIWLDIGASDFIQSNDGGTTTNTSALTSIAAFFMPAPMPLGSNFDIFAEGTYLNNSGGGIVPTFGLGFGLLSLGTTILTFTLPSQTTSANLHEWTMHLRARITATGGSGTIIAHGFVLMGAAAASQPIAITAANSFNGHGSATIDTTTATNLRVGASSGLSASATTTCTYASCSNSYR
jgi:hypothetical protein